MLVHDAGVTLDWRTTTIHATASEALGPAFGYQSPGQLNSVPFDAHHLAPDLTLTIYYPLNSIDRQFLLNL